MLMNFICAVTYNINVNHIISSQIYVCFLFKAAFSDNTTGILYEFSTNIPGLIIFCYIYLVLTENFT